MTQAYPLKWPAGIPETRNRIDSQFKNGGFLTPDRAVRDVLNELRMLNASHIVISTNVPIRNDGLPYADAARRKIDNPGVAVYFMRKEKQQVFACDKYLTVPENMRAIAKTIEALRGIERWGTGDAVDRAFSGFTALPAPAMEMGRHWSSVLDCPASADFDDIKTAYNRMAKKYHPDNQATGDAARMAEINAAYDQAKKEKGYV